MKAEFALQPQEDLQLHDSGQLPLAGFAEFDLDQALEASPANRSKRGQEILKRGLSYLHEALADWLLVNPGGTLREMGAHFGYSQSWLSQVINADMFKAYLDTRRGQIEVAIAQDLPTKLASAAHLATERIIEVVEKAEDSDTLIDAFDKIMHRYGYAPKPGAQPGAVNVQQNVFYLTRGDLAEAREKLVESHGNAALPAPE